MIMPSGIWQPTPEKVPNEFAKWLHREYGGDVVLAWNKRLGRWALFTVNRRTKKPTFIALIEDNGIFVPLNDGAKRIIKETVIHSSDVQRDDSRVNREVRDIEQRESDAFDEYVRDVLRDPVNARRITGNNGRKGPGATARKALEDARKKRGE